ncbi:MAG: dehydrogenase, partial [Planctomycetes bacterium]|nr:dehydrogenase [Planctomycetota bacterium]
MTTSAAVPGRAETAYHFGAARVDITPDGPVRLSGYGGRREEAAKVAQRLWGKALALREGDGPPLLLLAVDSIGVPAVVTEEVAERVRRKTGLPRERLALASTHSHTAPCLKGNLETLFGVPVPPDHQERIDRYTRELTDKLERAALDALAGKERCTLAWAVGRAGFATNRRTPGGPTDHGLPVLRVADGAGKVRVVVASYACHSTTLGPELNEVCGDWAGYAQAYVEQAHPGATALFATGCGANVCPRPENGIDVARSHGAELAGAVAAALKEPRLD